MLVTIQLEIEEISEYPIGNIHLFYEPQHPQKYEQLTDIHIISQYSRLRAFRPIIRMHISFMFYGIHAEKSG